jgi:hypothetical protein
LRETEIDVLIRVGGSLVIAGVISLSCGRLCTGSSMIIPVTRKSAE